MVRIISVCAEAQSGKDTFCNYLADAFLSSSLATTQKNFADTFKDSLCVALGFSEAQLRGDLKDVEDPYWGLAPRVFFQAIGHGMRELISPEIWIKAPTSPIVLAKKDPNRVYLVSDNRYPNETKALRDAGAYTVKLRRSKWLRGSIVNAEHPSEMQIQGCLCHEIVDNDSRLNALRNKAHAVAERALSHWAKNSGDSMPEL